MNRTATTTARLLIAATAILVWGCPFQLGRTDSGGGVNDSNGSAGDREDDAEANGGGNDGDDANAPCPADGVEGDPAVGATIFADNACFICHGDDGSGLTGPDIRFVEIDTLDERLRDAETTHLGGLFADLTNEDLTHLAAFLSDGGGPGPEDDETPPEDIHRIALGASGVLHGEEYPDPQTNCAACHGSDLSGSDFAPSCTSCHAPLWQGVDGPPPTHTEPRGPEGILHRPGFADPGAHCSVCHGTDLEGSGSRPSCTSCHDQLWPGAGVPSNHLLSLGEPAVMHREDLFEPETNCTACHGGDLTGVGSVPNCYTCHGPLWAGGGGPPPTHTQVLTTADVTGAHAEGRQDPGTNCAPCHQADLMGRYRVPACYSCHGQLWSGGGAPPSHDELLTNGPVSGLHHPGRADPQANCASCHRSDLTGTSLTPACWSCHGSLWDPPPDYPPDHAVLQGSPPAVHRSDATNPTSNCSACHGADLTGTPLIPNCYTCHGSLWSDGGPPPTHTQVLTTADVTGAHAEGRGSPDANCTECHQADLMGRYGVPACYSCHGQLWSGGGAPPSHDELLTNGPVSGLHHPGRADPQANCASCHRSDLTGTSLTPACWSCHGSLWDAPPDYPPTHTKVEDGFHHDPGMETPLGNCDSCHGLELAGTPLIPSCYSCHGAEWSDDDDHDDDDDDDDDSDDDDDDDDSDDDDDDDDGRPEGEFVLSRNADYSTDDREFTRGETLYMRVFSDWVDYNDLDKAEWELKAGGDRVKQPLANHFDGAYTASFDLSELPSEATYWTWKAKVEDDGGSKFRPTADITVLP